MKLKLRTRKILALPFLAIFLLQWIAEIADFVVLDHYWNHDRRVFEHRFAETELEGVDEARGNEKDLRLTVPEQAWQGEPCSVLLYLSRAHQLLSKALAPQPCGIAPSGIVSVRLVRRSVFTSILSQAPKHSPPKPQNA